MDGKDNRVLKLSIEVVRCEVERSTRSSDNWAVISLSKDIGFTSVENA